MCGIVAVLTGEPDRAVPTLAEVGALLDAAARELPFAADDAGLEARLVRCAEAVEGADELLRGIGGLRCLASEAGSAALLRSRLDEVWRHAETLEAALDAPGGFVGADLEALNAGLVRVKDAVWSVTRDRLGTLEAAIDLAGRDAGPHAVVSFAQIEIALAAIDRLEVRGRDSAGLLVVVSGHGLDPGASTGSAGIAAQVRERASDPLLRSGSVRSEGDVLCFVYKAAAEIGELGDNTRVLRDAIRSDALLRRALSAASARVLVLGHTRWASVGMISEPNAHPLAGDEVEDAAGPLVFGALNGDIDNHVDIAAAEELRVPLEVTTDAKMIPVLVSRRLAAGADDVSEAFRQTVASFEGSVAIAAAAASTPDRVYLALRGSGQALYVGTTDGMYVVASEPYGLVEQSRTYLRMDGESQSEGANAAFRGQIVVLDAAVAGTTAGIRRMGYDGSSAPVEERELVRAEITTRDVDRGEYPHFLLKELHDSPRSFRKTLRGKLHTENGTARVVLGEETITPALRERLASGAIRHVLVTGQGTAAVAGLAVGGALRAALEPAPIVVDAVPAPEISGFGIREDMSDTLLVAISQSGTTTDTNRTVEVARARGALVVAIVNRRQSDLVDRADGVLYTSDGRDVEMAVPSTKAFYAQVAAGFLLAAAVAELVPGASGVETGVLRALGELPAAMEAVIAKRDEIAEIARRHAPYRRDWAVVGNGANRVAAEEVRIKLSELCYKSVSCDVTEEKKHIDLSAEPLIFVCAAGLSGSNAEDVGKEIVYFRAHKAAPIVVAGEGEGRYEAALDVIWVPSVHPKVAFVLSAMAGHLFGYEAALAVDAMALPLRRARAAIEEASEQTTGRHDAAEVFDRVRPELRPIAGRFAEGLRSGAYNGHLGPSTAVRLSSLFRYATGLTPLDAYQSEFGKSGTPFEVLEDLMEALTTGIDELTRPVDAIRHQAKTVTVGITRAEETLLQVPLVREVLAAGIARDRLSYGTLRTLAALDPAVAGVTGYTHYAVEGDVDGDALVRITDRGGIARDIPSRTDRDPRLRGTKHRVAVEREPLVTRGHDGRTLVIVPEAKANEVTGLALLHVRFQERLAPEVMRSVLQGYRDRYSALRDTVTETEPTFRDDVLGELPVVDLLIASIQALAQHWRTD